MANCTSKSIIALIVIVISLVVAFISTGTDHWANYELATVEKHKGLIKKCDNFGCKNWADWDDYPDYIKGCLSAMVLGFLCTAASGIVWIFWMCGLCNNGTIMMILKVLTMILLTAGMALVLIAVIVFAVKDKDNTFYTEYHRAWSWGLAILTAILQLIAALGICGAHATGNLA